MNNIPLFNDTNKVLTNIQLVGAIVNGKIGDYYIKELKESEKKPTQLDNFIKQEKVNILIDNKLNSLVYYNLRRTQHILIYPNLSDINTVKDTIELLLIDT